MILSKSEKLVLDLAQEEPTVNFIQNKVSGEAFLHFWDTARKLELKGLVQFKETYNKEMYITTV